MPKAVARHLEATREAWTGRDWLGEAELEYSEYHCALILCKSWLSIWYVHIFSHILPIIFPINMYTHTSSYICNPYIVQSIMYCSIDIQQFKKGCSMLTTATVSFLWLPQLFISTVFKWISANNSQYSTCIRSEIYTDVKLRPSAKWIQMTLSLSAESPWIWNHEHILKPRQNSCRLCIFLQ